MEPRSEKAGLNPSELVIIAATAVIVVVIAVIIINPGNIIAKARDSKRMADLAAATTALNLYLADGHDFGGVSSNKIYDSTSKNTKINATGWIPVDLTQISSGTPLAELPLDPKNDQSLDLYYRFGVNQTNKAYEIDCKFESADNLIRQTSDGGNNPTRYELGSDLTILP